MGWVPTLCHSWAELHVLPLLSSPVLSLLSWAQCVAQWHCQGSASLVTSQALMGTRLLLWKTAGSCHFPPNSQSPVRVRVCHALPAPGAAQSPERFPAF